MINRPVREDQEATSPIAKGEYCYVPLEIGVTKSPNGLSKYWARLIKAVASQKLDLRDWNEPIH